MAVDIFLIKGSVPYVIIDIDAKIQYRIIIEFFACLIGHMLSFKCYFSFSSSSLSLSLSLFSSYNRYILFICNTEVGYTRKGYKKQLKNFDGLISIPLDPKRSVYYGAMIKFPEAVHAKSPIIGLSGI